MVVRGDCELSGPRISFFSLDMTWRGPQQVLGTAICQVTGLVVEIVVLVIGLEMLATGLEMLVTGQLVLVTGLVVLVTGLILVLGTPTEFW